jgi:hypothetical protein
MRIDRRLSVRDDRSMAMGDLIERIIDRLHRTYPYAYCDDCLALDLMESNIERVTIAASEVATLDAFIRTRRECSRCGQTRQLTALR